MTQFYEGPGLFQPDLALWIGAVTFAARPEAGAYRLLVEEFEYISANYKEGRRAPGRLIYAETFEWLMRSVSSARLQRGPREENKVGCNFRA